MPAEPIARSQLLRLSDAELLKLCQTQAYKGSGPGGQHRNKTNSGVKIKLEFKGVASGEWLVVETYSCDDRSAHINKLFALKKLRMKIALQIREEPALQIPFAFPGTAGKISADNKFYPEFIADVLDRIKAAGGDLSDAARMWGLSKSALNKIILVDKKVLEALRSLTTVTHLLSKNRKTLSTTVSASSSMLFGCL